jgi:putative phage-type endonuclease
MLWQQKTGRMVQEVNFAMTRGTSLEPSARRSYEELTGNVMEPAVVVDGDYSASLDGVTIDGDQILEIKVPLQGRDGETWKAAEAGKVPGHYVPQVQHQLMVSGASLADFFVYDGEEGLLVQVGPDIGVQQALRTAWDDFWKHVELDQPPELGPLDVAVRSDEAWVGAAQRFLSCRVGSLEAQKALEAARNELTGLSRHVSQEGAGVLVTRVSKTNGTGKAEWRVTVKEVNGAV